MSLLGPSGPYIVLGIRSRTQIVLLQVDDTMWETEFMTSDRTAREQLLGLATGAWISQAIHVAAKLRLADLLAEGPKTPESLAAATATQADALYRLLRALESVGVFAHDRDGRFSLTPMAEQLRSDMPGSLRAYAIMLGERWHWNAWGELSHSIETGEPAFDCVHGKSIFSYLASDTEAGLVFNEAMSSRSGQEIPAILQAYAWPAGTISDVGGGQGHLLAEILRARSEARGILFDLPQVVASMQLSLAGLTDRLEKIAGSFFETVPKEADLYILKRILHDWDDAACERILANLRAAMNAKSRLLIIEHVLPEDGSASHGKLLDLQMLVMTSGGRERSEAEYRDLLARASLTVTRVIPTNAGISLVEAAPA